MKHVLNFIIGSSTTFILIAKQSLADIPPNWFELIKILCSIFGGVIATLLMNIIKKWFQNKNEIELINRLNKEKKELVIKLDKFEKVIKLDQKQMDELEKQLKNLNNPNEFKP